MSSLAQHARSRVGLLTLVAALAVAGAMPLAWAQQPEAKQAISEANQLSKAFRHAAHTAMPTVVKIKARTKQREVANRGSEENPFRGTPFEDMFRDFGGRFRVPPRDGVGSGVIIDESGIVLTNNHVVEGADEVIVVLSDHREFKATEVKTDPESDLAVVRFSGASDLPVAKLGNSDNLEIGDWVLAIGNPFELETTVSAGIISGRGRELGSIRRARFLQTDAAINPGNSGGPLVNLDGEVVGINTAIASSSGGYQGVGFAVPVNLARWVVPQLIEKGTVERAYLGVKIGAMTSELAEQFGSETTDGVIVGEVMPGTPAAEAGFRDGDVVTHFGGRRVHTPTELTEMVERTPFGTKQKVQVLRDGKPHELSVTVKRMPADFAKADDADVEAMPESARGHTEAGAKLGLEVADLGADEARQLGYEGQTGVLITSVEEGGAAYQKGVREGMLIRRVGRQAVSNSAEFEKALEDASLEEGVLLLVRTPQGRQFFVVVKS
ncbi:MAG: Do family serine endopeptidase [Pirellulales bacterium]